MRRYSFDAARWLCSQERIRLCAESRGVYRDLIDFCWTKGSFPSDMKLLSRMLMVSRATLRRAWTQMECYFVIDGDRCYCPRVAVERQRILAAAERRQARKEAKGGIK